MAVYWSIKITKVRQQHVKYNQINFFFRNTNYIINCLTIKASYIFIFCIKAKNILLASNRPTIPHFLSSHPWCCPSSSVSFPSLPVTPSNILYTHIPSLLSLHGRTILTSFPHFLGYFFYLNWIVILLSSPWSKRVSHTSDFPHSAAQSIVLYCSSTLQRLKPLTFIWVKSYKGPLKPLSFIWVKSYFIKGPLKLLAKHHLNIVNNFVCKNKHLRSYCL